MEIEVIESWIIKGTGIITELKNIDKGLPNGTCLISLQTGYKWIVKGRLIFYHIAETQKRFPGECEVPMHFIFSKNENMEKSKKALLDKENAGIYQYLIEPVQHSEKPMHLEKLEIKK
jgi:hypothetical protein